MTSNGKLLGSMYNVGVRAADLESELEFLQAFAPSKVERIARKAAFGPKEIVGVELGGVSFYLFEEVIYDGALRDQALPTPGGISHISFLVDSTEKVIAAAARVGAEPILKPYESTLEGKGSRRVAFFRSPNGTVVESQELFD